MTPKQMFLRNAARVEHAKQILKEPALEELLHTAYAEYCWGLPNAEHPQQSWAANARRQGALDFIHVLLSLADPAKRLEKPKSGQLEREDVRTPDANPGA